MNGGRERERNPRFPITTGPIYEVGTYTQTRVVSSADGPGSY
jgi:hypothetical protein